MEEISNFIRDNRELFDLLGQILILVIPFLLTWFVRTYVKSAESEKRVAAIVRLSNAAIDYAEDLHERGDLEEWMKKLNLPQEILDHASTGIQKLNVAGKFVEDELGRLGIKMTDQEAKAWIAAEFQRRVGDVGQKRRVVERTQEAINLLQSMARAGLISLPADVLQATELADKVADWVLDQLGEDKASSVRQEALIRAQAALLMATQSPTSVHEETPVSPLEAPSVDAPEESVVSPLEAPIVDVPEVSLEARLAELAKQSLLYIEQLKRDHELTLPEADIAAAWVLTEVTKQRLDVTTDQIARAVRAAFEQ
jgi:hypothetical protein